MAFPLSLFFLCLPQLSVSIRRAIQFSANATTVRIPKKRKAVVLDAGESTKTSLVMQLLIKDYFDRTRAHDEAKMSKAEADKKRQEEDKLTAAIQSVPENLNKCWESKSAVQCMKYYLNFIKLAVKLLPAGDTLSQVIGFLGDALDEPEPQKVQSALPSHPRIVYEAMKLHLDEFKKEIWKDKFDELMVRVQNSMDKLRRDDITGMTIDDFSQENGVLEALRIQDDLASKKFSQEIDKLCVDPFGGKTPKEVWEQVAKESWPNKRNEGEWLLVPEREITKAHAMASSKAVKKRAGFPSTYNHAKYPWSGILRPEGEDNGGGFSFARKVGTIVEQYNYRLIYAQTYAVLSTRMRFLMKKIAINGTKTRSRQKAQAQLPRYDDQMEGFFRQVNAFDVLKKGSIPMGEASGLLEHWLAFSSGLRNEWDKYAAQCSETYEQENILDNLIAWIAGKWLLVKKCDRNALDTLMYKALASAMQTFGMLCSGSTSELLKSSTIAEWEDAFHAKRIPPQGRHVWHRGRIDHEEGTPGWHEECAEGTDEHTHSGDGLWECGMYWRQSNVRQASIDGSLWNAWSRP